MHTLSSVPTAGVSLGKESPKHELTNQYLFFHSVFTIISQALWHFYVILLLRRTGNEISVAFLSYGGLLTGILVGYLVGSLLINRWGYLHIFRLSMAVLMIATGITVVTLPELTNVYILLQIICGIGEGMFWVAGNLVNVREVHGNERTSMMSVLTSFGLLISVIIPILAGGFIEKFGYEPMFLLAMVFYGVAIIYPWDYNKVPRNQFRLSELNRAYSRRGFKRWTALTFITEIMKIQRALLIMILPFLFIGSEFGVGALGSFLGLMGVALAFTHRHDSFKKLKSFAYIGGWMISLSTLVLILVWSLPMMVIRGLFVKLGVSLFEPAYNDIVFRNRELLLGDFVNESAVELQLYVEVVLYAARIFTILLSVICLAVIQLPPMEILKLMLLATIPLELGGFYLHVHLQKLLRRG